MSCFNLLAEGVAPTTLTCPRARCEDILPVDLEGFIKSCFLWRGTSLLFLVVDLVVVEVLSDPIWNGAVVIVSIDSFVDCPLPLPSPLVVLPFVFVFAFAFELVLVADEISNAVGDRKPVDDLGVKPVASPPFPLGWMFRLVLVLPLSLPLSFPLPLEEDGVRKLVAALINDLGVLEPLRGVVSVLRRLKILE